MNNTNNNNNNNANKTIGIIPARFCSTRFPGKPLAKIAGKPMILWTYENAKKSHTLDDLFVATDNQEIYVLIKKNGGKVIMTGDCQNGTERCMEVVDKLEKLHNDFSYKYIINIQGDEPMVDPDHIDTLVNLLKNNDECQMTALATQINSEEEARNSSITKVIFNSEMDMIYASRAMIPCSKSGKFNPNVKYFRNCGMYGFTREYLEKYSFSSSTPLQIEEDLEQLKAIENGVKIKLALVNNVEHGIDLPEQLDKLDKKIRNLM